MPNNYFILKIAFRKIEIFLFFFNILHYFPSNNLVFGKKKIEIFNNISENNIISVELARVQKFYGLCPQRKKLGMNVWMKARHLVVRSS